MKREFLTELGIESKEVIDKIMAENGKDVETAKGDAETVRQQSAAKDVEIAGLKGQITRRDSDIAELRKSSDAGAALQQKLDDLQNKYTTDTANLQRKLDEQKTEFETSAATEKFFADVKFSSDLAKEAAIAQFKSKAFKLSEGVFQGAKEWLEDLKKSSPTAFAAEDDAGHADDGSGVVFPSFTKSLTNNGTGIGGQQVQTGGGGDQTQPFGNGWNFTVVRSSNSGR